MPGAEFTVGFIEVSIPEGTPVLTLSIDGNTGLLGTEQAGSGPSFAKRGAEGLIGIDRRIGGAASCIDISVKQRTVLTVLRKIGKGVDHTGQVCAGLGPPGEIKPGLSTVRNGVHRGLCPQDFSQIEKHIPEQPLFILGQESKTAIFHFITGDAV